MAWETSGTAILAAASITSPSADQTAWAALCAAGVNAAIETRLNGYEVVASSNAEAELARSALLDGVEFFRSKDARMGVLTFGPDNEPVRVTTDILWSVPVIGRYATPGIG